MKRISLLLIVIFVMVESLFSQEYLKWRWSDQPIMQMPDASFLHMVGSAYLAETLSKRMHPLKADLLTLSLGIAWEIKDGLIPYEEAGYLGAEGFSVNDLKMDIIGIIMNRLGGYLLKRGSGNYGSTYFSFNWKKDRNAVATLSVNF